MCMISVLRRHNFCGNVTEIFFRKNECPRKMSVTQIRCHMLLLSLYRNNSHMSNYKLGWDIMLSNKYSIPLVMQGNWGEETSTRIDDNPDL
jgi:hypothetical protein